MLLDNIVRTFFYGLYTSKVMIKIEMNGPFDYRYKCRIKKVLQEERGHFW